MAARVTLVTMVNFQAMRAAVLLGVLTLVVGSARGADDLADGFKSPPDSARPHTWWHWVSGNVSKDGITKDLESMKRIGVGGAQLFSVNQGPAGPVKYMSPQWREMVK